MLRKSALLLPRLLVLLTLLWCPVAGASVYDYPVELNSDIGGLKLTVNSSPGPLAKVIIISKETAPVACRAEFNSGLQPPVVRVAPLKPGKRAILTYSVPKDITKLKINLSCKLRGAAKT